MNSCLYLGSVRHRRFAPVSNEFTYSVFFAYLDLDELETVFAGRWLWSTTRAAVARFRREDHFGEQNEPLADSVRRLVEQQTGVRPLGPIRMLTQLRVFGYLMNPVAFFYCFNESGTQVESVVAEVTNTPWGERHCYVLDHATLAGNGSNTRKEFHVSPFMEMNMEYAWAVGEPGETLSMSIDESYVPSYPSASGSLPASSSAVVSDMGQPSRHFDVSMHLERRPISGPDLAKTLLRHPFMTGKIAAAIYWQAVKLWWKGCPFVPHPNQTSESMIDSVSSPSCPMDGLEAISTTAHS